MGHCYSIMHDYETIQFQVLSMRLYKFSGGGGLTGEIPGPPPSLYDTLYMYTINSYLSPGRVTDQRLKCANILYVTHFTSLIT